MGITIDPKKGIKISSLPKEEQDNAKFWDEGGNGDGYIDGKDPTTGELYRELLAKYGPEAGGGDATGTVTPQGSFEPSIVTEPKELKQPDYTPTLVSTGAHLAASVKTAGAGAIIGRVVRQPPAVLGAMAKLWRNLVPAEGGAAAATSAATITRGMKMAKAAKGAGLVGLAVGTLASVGENTVAVVLGTRTMNQAAKECAKDVAVSVLVGAGTAALVVAGAGPIVAFGVGLAASYGLHWIGKKAYDAVR
ncbi:MAG: hypothetical protein HY903_17690 [Deltaproteobacteria bacterium]|nr:hypothetical protein [Deltaproteobacteria bacterium]